jgi:hypothetical protein
MINVEGASSGKIMLEHRIPLVSDSAQLKQTLGTSGEASRAGCVA